jgi:hypothetical protein
MPLQCAFFLAEAEDVDDGKYPHGIEYEQADKPCQVMVSTGPPQRYCLPDAIPDGQRGKKQHDPSRVLKHSQLIHFHPPLLTIIRICLLCVKNNFMLAAHVHFSGLKTLML